MTLFGGPRTGMASEHSPPRRDLSAGPVWRVSRPARSHQGFTSKRHLKTRLFTREVTYMMLPETAMMRLRSRPFRCAMGSAVAAIQDAKIFYGLANAGDSRVTVPFSKSLK